MPSPTRASWAPRLRSSDYRAIADDAAKDDEAVGFLGALPLAQQAEWLPRLRWIRLADRLSENELLEPQRGRFARFRASWRAFVTEGETSGEHEEVWREMQAVWLTPAGERREPRAMAAWGEYLDALGDYTRPGTVLPTLADHDRMLRRLTGNLFEVLPYLTDEQRDAAASFGALDQMMNNLRDIAEDASHGLCFFPTDVLDRFGVRREAILDGSAVDESTLSALMHFWLDEHLTDVRRGARAFRVQHALHPSLVRFREACLLRYERVEKVLRLVDMDYLAFPGAYWGHDLLDGTARSA